MEGWVPSSRIAPLNKKNIKRLREVDNIYVEKVVFRLKHHFQKAPAEPTLLEKEQGELTKVELICKRIMDRLKGLSTLNQGAMRSVAGIILPILNPIKFQNYIFVSTA